MRVLHVFNTIAPRIGGASTLIGLARALARQGCDVSVFATDLDEQGQLLPWRQPRRLVVPTDRSIDDGGVRLRYFPVSWPSRYSCSWQMAAALRREIPTFDLVQIHALYLFHGLVAAYYCRKAGVPYVIQPHGGLDPSHRSHHWGRKAAYERLIERHNLDRATSLHFTSPAEATHARQAGVTRPGFVVGLGIDPVEYATLPERGRFRAKFPQVGQGPLVVFMGRITPKKGFDLLLPALARVAADVPDVHLVLAGPDDEGYSSVVKDLIRQHGLGPRVTWTGMVTGQDKLELLRDADVWTLPSHDENFAIAAVEAMAAGAPVLVTDRVGVHQAVIRGDAGVVVQPTVAAVAEGLATLLKDDAQRQRQGANARHLALTTFSWDVAAASLLQEYRAIVRRVAPRAAYSPAT